MILKQRLHFAVVIRFLHIAGAGRAQDAVITLSGKIVEAGTSKPVPFANLQLLSTGLGTSANENGDHIFKVPQKFAGDTLLITSIGYKTSKRSSYT